jgi:hypothetical protein
MVYLQYMMRIICPTQEIIRLTCALVDNLLLARKIAPQSWQSCVPTGCDPRCRDREMFLTRQSLAIYRGFNRPAPHALIRPPCAYGVNKGWRV